MRNNAISKPFHLSISHHVSEEVNPRFPCGIMTVVRHDLSDVSSKEVSSQLLLSSRVLSSLKYNDNGIISRRTVSAAHSDDGLTPPSPQFNNTSIKRH